MINTNFSILQFPNKIQDIFIIALLCCTWLLAVVFTRKYQFSRKIYLFIGTINLATIALFLTKNLAVFFTLIILNLMIILAAASKNSGSRKIMTIYIAMAKLVLIFLLLFTNPVNTTLIFYALLIPFLGLFPFQTWYINLFEKFPLGIVTAFIAFQAVTIFTGESLLKATEIINLQWALALASLASSILAILQNQTKRSLAYIISSQLGFLAFSHLTNSGAASLGSVYLTISLLGATTAFVMMIAALEMRKTDLSLLKPNGCYESYPKLSFWLLIFGLISSGLPLSVGYIAEDLIFESGFRTTPVIDVLWLISIAINTILIVKIFLFLCNGTAKKENGLDLRKHESWAVILVFFIILLATFLLT